MSNLPVIFVLPEYIDKTKNIITVNNTDEIHHLINVLRLKVLNQVVIMDNLYNCYLSTIISIEIKQITLIINDISTLKKYPKININLVQAIIKPDKLDLIVQKATELGITKIINFYPDYCSEKKFNKDTILKKLIRLDKIALNAAKQSRRATLPYIEFNDSLESAFKTVYSDSKNNLYFAFVENTANVGYLKNVVKKNIENIFIFIGPEGGWSPNELELFEKYNVSQLTLGKNILRTETAAIVAIGTIIYEFELAE